MSDGEIEIWKDIKGYEGYYQVSNFGRIKSLDRTIIRSNGSICRRIGKILQCESLNSPYKKTRLGRGRHRGCYVRVHRLVAEAFVPNPLNAPEVDHINGNKKDNNAKNLRWVSKGQNTCNAKIRRDNTTGAKGVSWNKRDQSYQAYVNINQRRFTKFFTAKAHGGKELALEAAKKWVKEARVKFHKQYARYE